MNSDMVKPEKFGHLHLVYHFTVPLNTEHPSIKFEYEILKEIISFLDTKIYIKNNKLHTKIFRNKTDRQTFLHFNAKHPKSFRNSIPYSKTIWIKRISPNKKDFDYHSRALKERLLKQGYDQKLDDEQLEKVDKLVRDNLLHEKDKKQQDPKHIPLIFTYNWFLPTLQQLFTKTGTSSKPINIYENYSKNNFKRNKNLKEIIGETRIQNLEQENELHVSQAQELYVATKCWKQIYSWVNRQSEHLTFFLTLTVKVNTLFI